MEVAVVVVMTDYTVSEHDNEFEMSNIAHVFLADNTFSLTQ